jgi:hypothetical protein
VFDDDEVWILQLHRGATTTEGDVIVPGDVTHFRRFNVAEGIEALRTTVMAAKSNGEGIVLVGNVGITSHFGDILRRSGVPSYIERPEAS